MRIKPEQEANIQAALRSNGQEGDLITIALGTLFRPASDKLRNTVKKEFLSKAKVVASVGARDSYIGFMGARMMGSLQIVPTPIKNQDSPPSSPRVKPKGTSPPKSQHLQRANTSTRMHRSNSVTSVISTTYSEERSSPTPRRRPSAPVKLSRSQRPSSNDDLLSVSTSAIGPNKVR
jgi:hypothetical protein